MNIKPLGALTLMLSVAGCQPTIDSIKTDGTFVPPESAAEVSLTEFGGKWAGYWTTGERGTITIVGDDASALDVKFCYANHICQNIEEATFEGGAIRWSDGNRHYTFWFEGDVLRGVLKEFRSERWWTLYVWMDSVSGVPVVPS